MPLSALRTVLPIFGSAAWVSTATAAEPGNGFGSARLVDGAPDFSQCLDSADCASNFYAFLTQSMVEQGFSMQGHSVATSTLTHRRLGWRAGGALTTFPFGPPPKNLSGKEENTQFSPVFPHIWAGRAWEPARARQVGLGLSFTPPVPVKGARALALGLASSFTKGAEEEVRLGVEADLGFVRARAPIAATQDQLDARDSFSNPSNLDPERFASVCGPDIADGADGCIDTFTLLNFSVRAGQSWPLAYGFSPYVKVGATVVNEWLDIKYDSTRWGVFAVQPTAHAGMSANIGEHMFLSLGASAAFRQGNQSESGKWGLIPVVDGAAAWAF